MAKPQTFWGAVAQTKKKGHLGLLKQIIQFLQVYN